MGIQEAACEVFNAFLQNMRQYHNEHNEEISEANLRFFSGKEWLDILVKEMCGVTDGNTETLDVVAKYTQYMIHYHIDRKDIYTMSHVKLKIFEDGQKGWTSVHPDGLPEGLTA